VGDTVCMSVASKLNNVDNYENFFYSIGIVFAPSFAILLTDYYIMKQNIEAQKMQIPIF
jgi:purine-cytosine permease-like protein